MTDVRKCDGPKCEKQAVMGALIAFIGDRKADDFITLERPGNFDKHFCNERCLSNWVRENTRVV